MVCELHFNKAVIFLKGIIKKYCANKEKTFENPKQLLGQLLIPKVQKTDHMDNTHMSSVKLVSRDMYWLPNYPSTRRLSQISRKIFL